ncbi:VOC family protein [Paenibacillus sp. FSL H7-0331]|uniref:VOC family protein n=1 Tax=Paenibacillus sp. FSL H7-0331 TaxID=1920421 RepID=UPI00096D3BF7|nr:VOC family protein [Paenibacillus sp. FSL H7-0331]OMF19019.1 glyoxalase [Paenibacillus sp. FSL H7-0331]
MFKGIGHTAYNVIDMEKSLQFYCDVLGFQKCFELKNDKNEPWIVYLKVLNLQFIELFYNGKQGVDNDTKVTKGYNHLCLEVNDIHEIANHLKSKGLTLDVEPKMGADLNWQCWVRDPDGNRIEFMQLDPESPQAKS